MLISLIDLPVSLALDHKAMAELKGSGCDDWQFLGSNIVTGPWSGYKPLYVNYVGITFHDGYLSKQTMEAFARTRTQTEYSYWYHWTCA
jgi:hypothetical protein